MPLDLDAVGDVYLVGDEVTPRDDVDLKLAPDVTLS
jgi:hypothetical protein